MVECKKREIIVFSKFENTAGFEETVEMIEKSKQNEKHIFLCFTSILAAAVQPDYLKSKKLETILLAWYLLLHLKKSVIFHDRTGCCSLYFEEYE